MLVDATRLYNLRYWRRSGIDYCLWCKCDDILKVKLTTNMAMHKIQRAIEDCLLLPVLFSTLIVPHIQASIEGIRGYYLRHP